MSAIIQVGFQCKTKQRSAFYLLFACILFYLTTLIHLHWLNSVEYKIDYE